MDIENKEANCRSCGEHLEDVFCDLGVSPFANSYVSPEQIAKGERIFPLLTYVCRHCYLVQLEEFQSPEDIFSDYAYFSSFSSSWLEHCQTYAEKMIKELDISASDLVVEIASNDGYLLQFFKEQDKRVLGIEPAKNVAAVAIEKGIDTEVAFFGVETAQRLAQNKRPKLMVANNVLAHVPDINDFVGGIKILLDKKGVITIEFPHLLNLIEKNQFDTIYHEHFSYLSLLAVENIFERHQLKVFDVEELSTHGGSLRIFGTHIDNDECVETEGLQKIRNKEIESKFKEVSTYTDFNNRAIFVKNELLKFLIQCQENGETVVAYGAAAKGVTLLNYCGIGHDHIKCVVDKNPVKQNKYIPGRKIPIYSPDIIKELRPDKILILPWNISGEIKKSLEFTKEWGCEIYTAIPSLNQI